LRKLKLAALLPSIEGLLQIALWYWERHSAPTILVYEQIGVPAARFIALALNAPAAVFALSIYYAVDGPDWISDTGFHLLYLVCILAFWFLIGSWLDRRSSTTNEASSFLVKHLAIGRLALRILMVAMGVFFVLLALHLNFPAQGEKISKALLLVWSLLLLLIPGVAFVRWLRKIFSRQDG
jgi:hypothetical protein